MEGGMVKPVIAGAVAAAFLCISPLAQAQTVENKKVQAVEPFEGSVLVEGLQSPWDMVWGYDGQIWVTEREGKKITRVDPKTGKRNVAAEVKDVHTGPQHEGILGIALEPGMGKPGSKNYVYFSHTYMDGDKEHARIMRMRYDEKTQKLVEPTVILSGLPAGNDHNGGRLRFGPDGKLYYSIGEQGHNQGENFCKPIDAQRLPTEDELKGENYSAYAGKVLRLNVDGSIPEDNPVIQGIKSHIFTYGHRNPQGLVFVGERLYSSEHGPSTDDEINLLEAGGNYGWPYVAGFQDDQAYVYGNWSAAPNCRDLTFDPNVMPAEVPRQKETEWKADNFHEPLKTFYTVSDNYNFNDPKCADLPYLCWATIAPSSIAYYPSDGPIEGWENSLLVTSLKNGALYRVVLEEDGKSVQGDVAKYFHTPNRYRVALVSPDKKKIYIATDNKGNGFDMDGKPTSKMENPGSILVFEYVGESD